MNIANGLIRILLFMVVLESQASDATEEAQRYLSSQAQISEDKNCVVVSVIFDENSKTSRRAEIGESIRGAFREENIAIIYDERGFKNLKTTIFLHIDGYALGGIRSAADLKLGSDIAKMIGVSSPGSELMPANAWTLEDKYTLRTLGFAQKDSAKSTDSVALLSNYIKVSSLIGPVVVIYGKALTPEEFSDREKSESKEEQDRLLQASKARLSSYTRRVQAEISSLGLGEQSITTLVVLGEQLPLLYAWLVKQHDALRGVNRTTKAMFEFLVFNGAKAILGTKGAWHAEGSLFTYNKNAKRSQTQCWTVAREVLSSLKRVPSSDSNDRFSSDSVSRSSWLNLGVRGAILPLASYHRLCAGYYDGISKTAPNSASRVRYLDSYVNPEDLFFVLEGK